MMSMMRSEYYYCHSSCSAWKNVVVVFLWLLILTTTTSFANLSWSNNALAAVAATTQQQQQQQQAASSAASSSSLSSYEAVRAMDSYGDAVQLRHAQAAADVQGRLVIAIMKKRKQRGSGDDDNDEIWIFSVPPQADNNDFVPHHHRKIKGRRRNNNNNNSGDSRSSSENASISSGMVQQLSLGGVLSRSVVSGSAATTSTTTAGSMVAMVCTGIQADAVWLTRQLRAFCASLWERYNTEHHLSPVVVAQAVAFAKRQFWGYPMDRQWKMPLMASVIVNNNGWARPMGLRTLVLSTGGSRHQTPQMQLVEPSGIIRPIEGQGIGNGAVICMGRNSEAVQAHLEEKLVPKLSVLNQKQIRNAVFDALRHVLGPNATPSRILLEIVSSNGIDRQLISRT
jgi:20S proteasome alpha/beta subunit